MKKPKLVVVYLPKVDQEAINHCDFLDETKDEL